MVLEIDRVASDKIRATTVLSTAEEKIVYLQRYIPKVRMSPRNIIEELEILFVKERYTKGYKILKEGEFNENVYFVYSGQCTVLYPAPNEVKKFLSLEEKAKYKYCSLNQLSNI